MSAPISATDRFLRKMVGLFVDDWRFALTVAGWLLLAGLLLPRFSMAGGWAGLILFAGLGLILVDSVRRQARH